MAVWYLILTAVVLSAIPKPVKSTAEVMSHVTAHFGKSLDECREEVSYISYVNQEGFSVLFIFLLSSSSRPLERRGVHSCIWIAGFILLISNILSFILSVR